MKEEIKQALSSVFADRQRVQEERQAPQTRRSIDFATFLKMRDEVIKPALQELADFLTEKGQLAHVVMSDTKEGYQVTMKLALHRKEAQGMEAFPSFCCIYDPIGAVRFYAHQASISSPFGDRRQVRDVTKDWIQENFANWYLKNNPPPAKPQTPQSRQPALFTR